jgi:hypothetical protein
MSNTNLTKQIGGITSNSFVKIKKDDAICVVPISDVKVGDLILSYNLNRDESEFVKVAKIAQSEVEKRDQIKITTDDGIYIVTSAWQPFPIFDASRGVIRYIRSDKVKVGNMTVGDNELFKNVVKVERGEYVDYDTNFVKVDVEGNENYFCSTDNLDTNACFNLIHNSCI